MHAYQNIQWLSRRTLVIGLLLLFGALLLLSGIFLPLLLFLIGAFSYVYNRWYKGLPIGAELVTMTTLIASLTWGPALGALFGAITALAAYSIGDDFGATVPFYIAAAILVGLIGSLIPLPTIALVIITSIITIIIGELPDWIGPIEMKMYALSTLVTHIIFSVAMWKILGQYLFALAGLVA